VDCSKHKRKSLTQRISGKANIEGIDEIKEKYAEDARQ